MEAIAEYLIKSSVWLTGFATIYMLFLRNERFFTLNRAFLVSGMIASIGFPLINFCYTVWIPALTTVPTVVTTEPTATMVSAVAEKQISPPNLLFYAYLSGILYLIFRLLKQTFSVALIIKKSGFTLYNNVRLIRTDHYPAPFSFFSYVFVNPSVPETETREIVHHEQEHIRQRHWIDLALFEILGILQWFNPVIWLYGRFIRQNHEYLADEFALQKTSNPAMYRAALLNQMFGGPVIQLANSFNYSLNKKRFNMMKQTIPSSFRKLRLLLILPLAAGVFYAFATPEYKQLSSGEQQATEHVVVKQLTNESGNPTPEPVTISAPPSIPHKKAKEPDKTRKQAKPIDLAVEKTVKGKVVDANEKPLEGASIVVSGKTTGTVTDSEGNFMLKLNDSSPIVISYVGFQTVKTEPDFENQMTIRLSQQNIGIDAIVVVGYGTQKKELLKTTGPAEANSIESDKVFTLVEQMPEFPGGAIALRKFIASQIKYPVSAQKEKAQGTVLVRFVVNKDGMVSNVNVTKSVHPALDNEAIRVVYSLPKWKPGYQQEKAVDVAFTVPIEFVIQ